MIDIQLEGAKFRGKASFEDVIFSDKAYFAIVTFCLNAYFPDANFVDKPTSKAVSWDQVVFGLSKPPPDNVTGLIEGVAPV
ncbi:hypothetical protein [Acidithrix sp. C25]|uniref:hypothetical protein n=1 Tax=Acidithrix sp. C25 TaxID=1671482 RepID=UPI00191B97F7|nr:hypothetical protein [Acidithrix sp. C25]CAG4902905.1 unnamed protein product [Acidithrix sp. C25]